MYSNLDIHKGFNAVSSTLLIMHYNTTSILSNKSYDIMTKVTYINPILLHKCPLMRIPHAIVLPSDRLEVLHPMKFNTV